MAGRTLVRRRHRGTWTNLQRPRTHHRLQFGDHLFDAQRLAEEAAIGGSFSVGWFHLTGNQDDLDIGPAGMHGVSELQTVHAAWHLNIRKQHGDIRAGLQNSDRLIGVHSLNRAKSGILHEIGGAHAQHHLVLDDKHLGHFG